MPGFHHYALPYSSVAVSPLRRCKIPLFCKNYVRKFRSVTSVNGKKIRNGSGNSNGVRKRLTGTAKRQRNKNGNGMVETGHYCARACSKDNAAIADELVLSQEDQTRIHHSTRPVAVCGRTDHFSPRSWLQVTPTEDSTEAISYVTLSFSKQFLNYAIFIRFADKNLFTSAAMKTFTQLEKAAQGVAQCEVSATRVVVDAALLRGGKRRHGGHRIVNISRNCGRI